MRIAFDLGTHVSRRPLISYKMNNETFLETVYDKVINLFIGSWINCTNVYNKVYDRPIPVPPSAGYFIARECSQMRSFIKYFRLATIVHSCYCYSMRDLYGDSSLGRRTFECASSICHASLQKNVRRLSCLHGAICFKFRFNFHVHATDMVFGSFA